MRNVFILWLAVSLCPSTYAQTTRLDDLCQVFHLPNGKDTTTFIVFGTKEDLKVKKPLFLFRQGSQPMPFIRLDDGRYYLTTPFYFRDYKTEYHFVMIQKPGVRLVADTAFMDTFFQLLNQPDPPETVVSANYRENNHLDHYTAQCDQVIQYLVKQPWIDPRKVVFCGGSEGFTVGANLVANFNRSVTHTILFSGRTGRRFETVIRQVRKQIEQGEITPEQGQQEIDKLYQIWADICENPTSTDRRFGDTYRTWHSFSRGNLSNLLKITTPLYIAYGTADDEMAHDLDVLPLEFIANGKKNLTLKPYHNFDHQFFELKQDSTGKTTDKIYRGDDVARDWMEWLRK